MKCRFFLWSPMQEQIVIPDRREYEKKYELLHTAYEQILNELVQNVRDCMHSNGLHPTIKFRVKSFQSFFKKKLNFLKKAKAENKKVSLPVTDLIGMRLICPFMEDLQSAEDAIRESFTIIEVERKGADYSFKEFGYESTHILIEIPMELRKKYHAIDNAICEIQIRTILQDAWAEVEHELVYKAEFTPFDEPMKRKLAALNANLTLSDIIFQEIRDYQHQLNTELAKRRSDFYNKIEEAIDNDIPKNLPKKVRIEEPVQNEEMNKSSIDSLLLEALYAHNSSSFDKAISIYSSILHLNPKAHILAIIYKHRGMAYFAQSKYDEASNDFTSAIEIEAKCHKSYYYRGVVYAVKKIYGKAIEDFTKALELNPYHFFCLFRRSQAYFHIGDYPEALGDCDLALKIEPDNKEAIGLKALIQEKLAM